MVPSLALEVPEGQEGEKTWGKVGTLVKVLWAVAVKVELVMVRPFKVVVPETVRLPVMAASWRAVFCAKSLFRACGGGVKRRR